jgi:DNA-binding FrmR family transcriptional regulator
MHTPDDELFYHDHGDGIVHCHEHPPEETDMAGHIEHEHAHCEHGHVHTQSKAVVNRLSRAIGHLESVKRMVEDGRDCSEVLVQLAAVRSALNSTARVILKDHLEHCIADAVATGDTQQIEDLNDAIDKYIE